MDYGQIIIQRLEEGTLLRKAWTGEKDGKELACLLAAVAPECGYFGGARHCPAEVMPEWLAYLTPWIDDAGTEERWEGFVRRFAATAQHWGRLTRRHEYEVRALIVREAATHTTNPEAIAICNRVIKLCDEVAAGGEIDVEVFSAAAEAAVRAIGAVSTVWVDADAAVEAARVSAMAVEWDRVSSAADTAAEAAAAVARTSAAVTARTVSEVLAVKLAAADRIIDGILCVLESA